MVVHTLNLRLHPDDLTYIASHGGDKALIVDKVLWPLAEKFVERVGFEHVIAVGAGETPPGAIEYEELLASAEPTAVLRRTWTRGPRRRCATRAAPPAGRRASSTRTARSRSTRSPRRRTGRSASARPDTVLPVVPMFHANAWGFPFTCTLIGAKQVFPGPHLDPESLLDAFVQEERDGHRRACRRSGWGSCRRSTRTPAAGTCRRCAR